MLNPEEKKEITYTITVPNNAASGGHYIGIIFSARGNTQTNTNAAVRMGIASLIAISVPGTIQENLIGIMRVPFFQEYGPVPLAITLTNTGDIHLIPHGSLIIRNIFGKIVANIPLKTQRIFPEASKTYDLSFPGKWHIGKYTTELKLTYGNNQRLTTITSFVIFPWSIILISSLIFAIVILLILLILKKRQTTNDILLYKNIESLNHT
jgi:hypothetical protein